MNAPATSADVETPDRPWPLLIDIVLQIGCYFAVRYGLGADPVVALSVGAVLMALRIAVRSIRRRRAELVELLTLGLIAVSIAVALVSGQPRVVLLAQSCIGLVLCVFLGIGLLVRRPVAQDLLSQFIIRGDVGRAERWTASVGTARTRRTLAQLEVVWLITALTSTCLSLAAAGTLPVDVAVVVCQIVPFVAAGGGAAVTWLSTRALRHHVNGVDAPTQVVDRPELASTKRVCILALGSRGDVQPTIALALALRERGHDVVIAAMGSSLVSLVRSAGVEAHQLNETVPDHDENYRRVLHRPIKRIREYGRFLDRHIDSLSTQITEACDGADVLVAHSDGMDFAVATARGRVVIGYRFFPGTTNGAYSVTQYMSIGVVKSVLDRSPRWVKRLTWTWGDFTTWFHVKNAVNRHRESLGLQPFRSRRERNRALAGVPDLQLYDGALTADLAPEFTATKPMLGFLEVPPSAWAPPDRGRPDAPAELDRWLDAGTPPVYWGFGSMRVDDPDRLATDFADVCRARGERGLIVVGWSDLSTRDFGEHIMVVESVNHSTVLPRCRAAIHHGGAGTTAAALRAGLPSLICPVLADQPFWGTRVTELGVGICIPIKKLDRRRLDAGLEFLLGREAAHRARRLSALIGLGDIPARRAAYLVDMAIAGSEHPRPAPAVRSGDPRTREPLDFEAGPREHRVGAGLGDIMVESVAV